MIAAAAAVLLALAVAVPLATTSGGSTSAQVLAARKSCDISPYAAQYALGPRRAVLTETQGKYTAIVYGRHDQTGVCVTGPSVLDNATSNGVGEGTVAQGRIQFFVDLENSGRWQSTLFLGRVGAGVTAIRIRLSSGRSVSATVSRGWYLAWWSGRAHATTARITTRSGTHRFVLPAAARVGPESLSFRGGTFGFAG